MLLKFLIKVNLYMQTALNYISAVLMTEKNSPLSRKIFNLKLNFAKNSYIKLGVFFITEA